MRSARGRRAPSRLASTLFVVGCLGVLGATFMAGVMAGRFWPRQSSTPSATVAKESAPARGADRPARPTEPGPALTFYQDLTAPLTSPPPPAKPGKPGRAEKSERPGAAEAAPKPDRAAMPEVSPPASSTPGAFTIQVGAYKAR